MLLGAHRPSSAVTPEYAIGEGAGDMAVSGGALIQSQQPNSLQSSMVQRLPGPRAPGSHALEASGTRSLHTQCRTGPVHLSISLRSYTIR